MEIWKSDNMKEQASTIKAPEAAVADYVEDLKGQIGESRNLSANVETRLTVMFADLTATNSKDAKSKLNEIMDIQKDFESFRTRYESVAAMQVRWTCIARP